MPQACEESSKVMGTCVLPLKFMDLKIIHTQINSFFSNMVMNSLKYPEMIMATESFEKQQLPLK